MQENLSKPVHVFYAYCKRLMSKGAATSKEDMAAYVIVLSFCEPCTRSRVTGKICRTLAVIFNILLWFAAYAFISVAIWLLFIDHATKAYYTTFIILNIALHVVLVVGILILVIAFIGTFAASLKNELLIKLIYPGVARSSEAAKLAATNSGVAQSIKALLILIIAEIIGIILLVQNNRRIVNQTHAWYEEAFDAYPLCNDKRAIIDHVQSSMECCGIYEQSDFKKTFYTFPNYSSPPTSCYSDSFLISNQRIVVNEFTRGCIYKIDAHVHWLLKGWPVWFSVTVLFILEFGALIPAIFYLVYLRRRGRCGYDDDESDNEESCLIESADTVSIRGCEDFGKSLSLINDLPHPKM